MDKLEAEGDDADRTDQVKQRNNQSKKSRAKGGRADYPDVYTVTLENKDLKQITQDYDSACEIEVYLDVDHRRMSKDENFLALKLQLEVTQEKKEEKS